MKIEIDLIEIICIVPDFKELILGGVIPMARLVSSPSPASTPIARLRITRNRISLKKSLTMKKPCMNPWQKCTKQLRKIGGPNGRGSR
jgi:hypothetical protein